MVGTAATSNTIITLPVGFRPTGTGYFMASYTGTNMASPGALSSTGTVSLQGTLASYTSGRFRVSFVTNDPWPDVLP
jgi:hypothetical protein